MLNWIFIVMIAGSTLVAAYSGSMEQVTDAGIKSAKSAVELAIGLIGQMALWLGFMRVLREAGLMRAVGRKLAPVMNRLFPEVPADHPAMGAMIMNFAANMLGLANAATPFGLKAMAELNKLNPSPGIATNAMVRFLAINTSGLAVLPLGAIAVRATMGSHNAAGIFLPTLLATSTACVMAIVAVRVFERWRIFSVEREQAGLGVVAPAAAPAVVEIKGLAEAEEIAAERGRPTGWRAGLLPLFFVAIAFAIVQKVSAVDLPVFVQLREILSFWLLPVLMALIVLIGLSRRVKVYETFVGGAKEGFQIATTIIPFLVAILVAVGMFRASGSMDVLIKLLRPVTDLLGVPAETLPMALIRPLSGSGALGVMTETMKTYGPDSFPGFVASVMNGSMETTFYVLAVYYGSVQVRGTRHTVAACLVSDVAGLWSSVMWSHLFF